FKNLKFESLSEPNRSRNSIAYPVIKACEDPLEKEQIEKKLAEMQTECQQKPQQENQEQNQLVDPATASHTPSGSSRSHSASQGGIKSDSFSYGKNNPFRATNSKRETEDSQDPSSRFEVSFPYDPKRPPSTDNNKGTSVSADFEENSKTDSQTPSPNSSVNFPSARGISSQKYRPSTGNNNSPLAETDPIEGTTETSLGEKINKGVRRFLSSGEQYGLIDDSPSSGSATSSFLDWMSDQTRKAKTQALKAYDSMVGITRADFQRRLQLNDENVDLFELQREMFIKACKTHNCN
ncbi:MAG: hypothetical protein OXJ52_01025, partial [Oligoflexia bacterium]|nr:hypothetical protein [Oligoflexia bacterium]